MTYEAGIEAAGEAVAMLDLQKNTPYQIGRDAVEAFLGEVDAYTIDPDKAKHFEYDISEIPDMKSSGVLVPLRPKEGA